MKSKVKATATATAGTKAKPLATVIVPATIIAKISPLATAQAGADAAMKAADRQVVNVGTAIGTDKVLKAAFTKDGRPAVQTALKPHFIEAYKKAGKPEDYAIQQLSRVLTVAFPGGANADAPTQEKAKEQMARGIKENKETQVILGLASGKLAYKKDGTIIRTNKARRAHNAKKPLEAYNLAVGNAVTAGNIAKLPPLAMINGLLDSLKACNAITEDEADAISRAAQKTL